MRWLTSCLQIYLWRDAGVGWREVEVKQKAAARVGGVLRPWMQHQVTPSCGTNDDYVSPWTHADWAHGPMATRLCINFLPSYNGKQLLLPQSRDVVRQ